MAAMLAGIAAVASLAVERNRTRPVKPQECPKLVLHEGDESDPVQADQVDEIVATFTVEGYLAADTDAALGPAANELHAEVVRVLRAGFSAGTYPAGVLNVARGGCEWTLDEEEGHKPSMCFALEWRVRYAVDPDNPYQSA